MVVKDRAFKKFIASEEITKKVKQLARKINTDYKDKQPLFISILNGAFMFAGDLLKEVNVPCEISFIKVVSYQEMESSANVKQLIGLNENIFNKDVIVIEDIIDTGRTVSKMVEEFKSLGALSVEVVTLLQKIKERPVDINARYIGFEIPDKFVVGYGLDYERLGRNSKHLYQLKD